MEAKLAPSANLLALPEGTELVGDYRIKRVLGAGGFGITYLADETALSRLVTIKEYFPAEFAARKKTSAAPRSREVADDYKWGLDRFIEEAQTLARFDHPNIVRVHRYFRANNTAYMVLHFEQGGSFKAWLKGLKRAPRQAELDRMIAPMLDALEIIHNANYLHRDIAPDNIMVRKDGSPVLIDFGSARGSIASHSRTISALVKPGYSPYEQYATNAAKQGPWTDIYALGATLYHAITGKRPPDAPSRVVSDDYLPAHEAALGSYRSTFLDAIDKALRIEVTERPQRIAEWRGALLAPEPARKPRSSRLGLRDPIAKTLDRIKNSKVPRAGAGLAANLAANITARLATGFDSRARRTGEAAPDPTGLVPAPPDAPQPKGQLLDFIEGLKKHRPLALPAKLRTALSPARPEADAQTKTQSSRAPARIATLAQRLPPEPASGLGFGPAPPVLQRVPAEPAAAAKPAPAAKELARRAAEPARTEGATEPTLEPAPAAAQPRRRAGGRTPVRRWGSAAFKLAAAVAVASMAVAYQEATLRPASRGPAAASSSVEMTAIGRMQVLSGHQGPVIAVAGADEDRWIVSAGADATLRLWSGTSGSLVRTIALSEGAVTAFAVAERRALVGHGNGAVVLWDLELGERIATVRHGSDAITSLAFFGDGFLAARQDGSVALFEDGAQATEPAALLDGEDGGGPLVAAAHSRGLFVSSGLDRTVRLWRAPGPQLARTYRRLTDDITAIGIAPDGGYVAGGSSDGIVRVWLSSAWKSVPSRSVQVFRAHDGRVTAAALSAAGMLATAGEDGSVKLWTLHPARVMRAAAGGRVRTLSFTRDGRRLFAGGEDGSIRVWTLAQPATAGAI
jgi:serine/threonine protein kinase